MPPRILRRDHGECAMKRPTDRRTVLKTAGAAAVAVVAGAVAAQSADIRGAVTFEGGAVIPKGHLKIYLEDTAIEDKTRRRAGKTRIESDGGSKAIEFSLSAPASATGFANAADRCAPEPASLGFEESPGRSQGCVVGAGQIIRDTEGSRGSLSSSMHNILSVLQHVQIGATAVSVSQVDLAAAVSRTRARSR